MPPPRLSAISQLFARACITCVIPSLSSHAHPLSAPPNPRPRTHAHLHPHPRALAHLRLRTLFAFLERIPSLIPELEDHSHDEEKEVEEGTVERGTAGDDDNDGPRRSVLADALVNARESTARSFIEIQKALADQRGWDSNAPAVAPSLRLVARVDALRVLLHQSTPPEWPRFNFSEVTTVKQRESYSRVGKQVLLDLSISGVMATVLAGQEGEFDITAQVRDITCVGRSAPDEPEMAIIRPLPSKRVGAPSTADPFRGSIAEAAAAARAADSSESLPNEMPTEIRSELHSAHMRVSAACRYEGSVGASDEAATAAYQAQIAARTAEEHWPHLIEARACSLDPDDSAEHDSCYASSVALHLSPLQVILRAEVLGSVLRTLLPTLPEEHMEDMAAATTEDINLDEEPELDLPKLKLRILVHLPTVVVPRLTAPRRALVLRLGVLTASNTSTSVPIGQDGHGDPLLRHNDRIALRFHRVRLFVASRGDELDSWWNPKLGSRPRSLLHLDVNLALERTLGTSSKHAAAVAMMGDGLAHSLFADLNINGFDIDVRFSDLATASVIGEEISAHLELPDEHPHHNFSHLDPSGHRIDPHSSHPPGEATHGKGAASPRGRRMSAVPGAGTAPRVDIAVETPPAGRLRSGRARRSVRQGSTRASISESNADAERLLGAATTLIQSSARATNRLSKITPPTEAATMSINANVALPDGLSVHLVDDSTETVVPICEVAISKLTGSLYLKIASDGAPPVVSSNLDLELRAASMNCTNSKWEPIIEPWPLQAEVAMSGEGPKISIHAEEHLEIDLSYALVHDLLQALPKLARMQAEAAAATDDGLEPLDDGTTRVITDEHGHLIVEPKPTGPMKYLSSRASIAQSLLPRDSLAAGARGGTSEDGYHGVMHRRQAGELAHAVLNQTELPLVFEGLKQTTASPLGSSFVGRTSAWDTIRTAVTEKSIASANGGLVVFGTETNALTYSTECAQTRCNPMLVSAVQKGDIKLVRRLLDCNANPDSVAARGKQLSALQMAARHKHVEIAELLMKFGAKVEAETNDKHGYRAIHLAAKAASAPMIELLLSNGADALAMSKSGRTALSVVQAATRKSAKSMIYSAAHKITKHAACRALLKEAVEARLRAFHHLSYPEPRLAMLASTVSRSLSQQHALSPRACPLCAPAPLCSPLSSPTAFLLSSASPSFPPPRATTPKSGH